MTAKKRLHSHQLDMITTFLNSRLVEKVYIEQPLYFDNGNKNQVLLQFQRLYGLKHAARLWFDIFWDEMKRLGFSQSLYDSAFYFNGQGTYFAEYIDDLHIVGPELFLINELKAQLALKFKTTDLGLQVHYFGMEVSRDSDNITVTQTVFIDQLLKTHQMSNCNPVSTTMIERLFHAPVNNDFTPNPKDVSAYNEFTEVCNGWLVRPAPTFSKPPPNWAIIKWNPPTNAGAQFFISYVTLKVHRLEEFTIETGISPFLATRTAPGQMIYLTVDLQPGTCWYSTKAQFLNDEEDKQPFLHSHAKRRISHKQKLPMKLSGFEAF